MSLSRYLLLGLILGLIPLAVGCDQGRVAPGPPVVGTEWEAVQPQGDYDYAQERLLAFERANAIRLERGLSLLQRNSLVEIAAQRYTESLADYIAETDCRHGDRDGKRSWTFYEDLGGRFSWAGEIVACGFVNGVDAVNAWMTSPGHAALLTEPRTMAAAFGRASANGWPVWVGLFVENPSGPVPEPGRTPTRVSTPTATRVPTPTWMPGPQPTGTPGPGATPAVVIVGDVDTDVQIRAICARQDVFCIQR